MDNATKNMYFTLLSELDGFASTANQSVIFEVILTNKGHFFSSLAANNEVSNCSNYL